MTATRAEIVAWLRDFAKFDAQATAAADMIEADDIALVRESDELMTFRAHSIELTADLYAADTRIEALEALLELRTSDLGIVAEERDRLKEELAESRAIVDRVWKALGITTYEGARGKTIDEIVAEQQALLTDALAGLEQHGWAVIVDGAIDIKTVHDSRRAAIINWLIVSKGLVATWQASDEQIEAMWRANKHDAEAIEIVIAARSLVTRIRDTLNPQEKSRG